MNGNGVNGNGNGHGNPILFIEKHLPLILATMTLVVGVAAGYRQITTQLALVELRLQRIERDIDKIQEQNGGYYREYRPEKRPSQSEQRQ